MGRSGAESAEPRLGSKAGNLRGESDLRCL